MVLNKPEKKSGRNIDRTTGLYKIAAKILEKVKTGQSYKTLLYRAQYPNKLTLNAVLMNVFKWEKVLDILMEKSNILEKENNLEKNFASVIITEMMWSKFGLKGSAKNILAVKKYKHEFVKLMKENNLEKLVTSMPDKAWKPRYFRINTLLTTLEDTLKKLAENKFKKLKTPSTYKDFLELLKSKKFTKNCFLQDIHIKELLVFHPKVKFYKLEEYKNGNLIVQDKASCLAATLLNPKPESTVLDTCAAPGMKTSHLAAIMQNKGTLYAVDRCKERFDVMLKMLEKYGVTNAETFNMDALTFPYFDNVKYILVDPSCSGSGIVDRVRNDSEKNEGNEIRLKKLANVHAQLLNHAFKTYPCLERLVYSTCSSNPEENEAVVDEVVTINEDFELLDCTKMVEGWKNKGAPGYACSEKCLNAVPNVDYTNGFFIAVFGRKGLEIEEKDSSDKLNSSECDLKEPESINRSSSNVLKKSKNAKKKERRLQQSLAPTGMKKKGDKNEINSSSKLENTETNIQNLELASEKNIQIDGKSLPKVKKEVETTCEQVLKKKKRKLASNLNVTSTKKTKKK